MFVVLALQQSAKVPSIKTREGPPKKPAKNRQIAKLAKLCDRDAPKIKSMKMGKLNKYTAERPTRSVICGVRMGAKAIPTRFKDNPRIAAVLDTLNSAMTPEIPAVYAVTPKALSRKIKSNV